jgi:hypothetical protein
MAWDNPCSGWVREVKKTACRNVWDPYFCDLDVPILRQYCLRFRAASRRRASTPRLTAPEHHRLPDGVRTNGGLHRSSANPSHLAACCFRGARGVTCRILWSGPATFCHVLPQLAVGAHSLPHPAMRVGCFYPIHGNRGPPLWNPSRQLPPTIVWEGRGKNNPAMRVGRGESLALLRQPPGSCQEYIYIYIYTHRSTDV